MEGERRRNSLLKCGSRRRRILEATEALAPAAQIEASPLAVAEGDATSQPANFVGGLRDSSSTSLEEAYHPSRTSRTTDSRSVHINEWIIDNQADPAASLPSHAPLS